VKILLVNDNIGEFGGAERSLNLTAKMLREKGHAVEICGSTTGETLFSWVGRWYNPFSYLAVKKTISEFSPDIMHCNSVTRVISPSVMCAASKMNVPTVMTVRDPHLCCAKSWAVTKDGKDCPGFSLSCIRNCRGDQEGLAGIPFYLIKFLKVSLHRRIIAKHCCHFISPSRKLKELISREFNLSEDRCSYLPNFIDLEGTANPPDNINSRQFLFVGRVSREKGIDIAVSAIRILVEEKNISDIKLNIIGDGPVLKSLKDIVSSLRLDQNIQFLGKIDNERLKTYFQESCAVIMPSIWMENNPRVALEAMKFGKPIIASNIGGYPDLVEHEKTGYLFTPGDKNELADRILDLYDNKEFSAELGNRGFDKVKKEFNQEDHYQKLLSIYQRVSS
jgi:glycosyltransferase involved in cell wall biosynthesis